jgi:aspartate/methionine/tyrosine aminotransferase
MSEAKIEKTAIHINEGLRRAVSDPSWHRFDEIPQEILNDPETIHLNLSGGWQTVPEHIRDAGREAVDSGYLRIQAVPEFNLAVAEKFLKDFGVVVDPTNEVIPCHGAGDGMFAILSVLLNPGDEVITFDPTYTLSSAVPTFLGASVHTVPLADGGDWIPDLDLIESRVEQVLSPRTRIFILVNPDNPTGHVFHRDLLTRLGKKLRQHGVLVLEDQVYEKVVYPPNEFISMISIPGMRENTICVSSFAKSYLCAGMKAGYIVGPPELVQALRHYYMLNSFTPNTVALRAGADILSGPQGFLDDWIKQWDEFRQKTVQALNSIPGVSCHLPEAGTYCLADVGQLGPGEKIAHLLMERARVLVTPGSYYGSGGNNYIRVCYGRSQPDKIEQGLERIVDTLNS